MKSHIIAIAALVIICFSACAEPTAKDSKQDNHALLSPNKKIVSTLGNRLTDILFSPKQVDCYYLVATDSIKHGETEIEPDIVVGEKLSRLSKEEIAVLQYILLSDTGSYNNDSVAVMSPYKPCLDFQFSRKKETAHILVSLSDFSWAIVYDGKRQCRHNYHTNELERFCAYYLSKLNTKHEKK